MIYQSTVLILVHFLIYKIFLSGFMIYVICRGCSPNSLINGSFRERTIHINSETDFSQQKLIIIMRQRPKKKAQSRFASFMRSIRLHLRLAGPVPARQGCPHLKCEPTLALFISYFFSGLKKNIHHQTCIYFRLIFLKL